MGSLTGLKYEHTDLRFENASAEFDEQTLAPTYRLLWGVPGRSNALNIAARLGIPHDVVNSARDILGASQVGTPLTMHAHCFSQRDVLITNTYRRSGNCGESYPVSVVCIVRFSLRVQGPCK
jgi:DNA mismatch repair ATPase MutS